MAMNVAPNTRGREKTAKAKPVISVATAGRMGDMS